MNIKRLFLPVLLISLFVWGNFGRKTQAATTQLTFNQPAAIHVSTSFDISVDAASLADAATGFQWEVTFDPAVIAFRNVAIGDGLSATGREGVCAAPQVVSARRVRVACATIGDGAGQTADGALAILTFEALAIGASGINLEAIQLVDDEIAPTIFGAGISADTVIVEATPLSVGLRSFESSRANILPAIFLILLSLTLITYRLRRKSKLTNLQTFIHLLLIFTLTTQTFWPIPPIAHASPPTQHATRNTQHAIRSSSSNFSADLNGDQLVNINDLRQIATVWQCASGDGCFSADFDFNSDDLIDLFDLASVANEYDIEPPVITITTPTENAILTGSSVTVSGTFADAHAVTEILVNGNAATLDAGTFTIDLPTTDGTFPIHVAAVDKIGQTSGATRLVTVDGAGPFITVNLPRNRQAIYTTRPGFDIDYTDLIGLVDASTLQVILTDETGTPTDISNQLTANADTASGTLNFDLQEDETYTVTVSVQDTNGVQGTRISNFYVPTNANSITPPTWSDGAGFVSGYVYDSSTCGGEQQYDPIDCTGIAGATVTLEQIDATRLANARDARQAELIVSRSPHGLPHDASRAPEQFRQAVVGTVVTGVGGFFAFPVAETGNYAVRVEKDGFTYGQRLTDIVLEKSIATSDLYLTPLDAAVTPCDSAGCEHVSADGQMQLSVPAGALTGTQQIDIRATQFDQVQFLPSGELPPGTGETYAFNLSGASEITFTEPITVMLKNDRGFAPGAEIPLGYWNQTLQVWEDAGDVFVDETGEWLVMQVTHFSNFDPNSPVTANTVEVTASDETKKSGENCATDCDSSEIDIATGVLKQEFSLPTVNVLDTPMGVTLNYDSQRANPTAVIDIELGMQELVANAAQQVDGVLQAELFIEGESTDQFSFELGELEQDGEIGRFRYFWNGRDSQGQQVPPGVYNYVVRVKVPFQAQFFGTTNGLFGGPPDPTQPLGVFTTSTVDRFVSGSVLIGSNATNPYGTGWQVANVQRLYQAEDGSILIDDGDHTLTQYLFPFNDLTAETPQVRTFGAEVGSGKWEVGSEEWRVESGENALADDAPRNTHHAIRTTHHAPRITPSTIITSDIITDTVWTAANSPYLVENDITIAATATLTIEAGTEVRVDASSTVPDNIFVEGILLAQGSETDGVTFTDDGFRWGAIVVQAGGSAEFSHTRIEGAGQSGDGFDGRDAGLVVISGTLTMSNSVMFDSGNTTNRVDGCLLVQDSAVTLVDSVFEGCGSPGSFGRAAVAFFGANTTIQATNVLITDSHTFPLAYDLNTITSLPDITTDDPRALIFGNIVTNDTTISPTSNTNQFLVDGDVTIAASAALTLTEGTNWTFRNGTDDLIVNGGLALQGSQNAPVIVTSDEDDDFGQWGGIIVDGGLAEIDFATIRSGGRATFDTNRTGLIGVINGGSLSLSNSTLFRISDFSNALDSYVYVKDSTAVVEGSILTDDGANLANPAFGFHVEDTGATDVSFDNNVVVHRSSLARIPNHLLDRIGPNNLFSTDNNQRIQIEGGTVAQVSIAPIGNLNSFEYATNLTVTEAMTVAEGVRLRNDNRFLTLDGATLVARGSAENPISFEAIDASGSRGIRLINGAHADLEFVTVKEAQFGISVLSDSGLTLKNSIITNNDFGIFADDTVSEFTVLLNEISGNTTRGLQNQTTPTQLLDARFNFWGSATGPTHVSNPAGTGDTVGGSVLVVPFLRGNVEGGGNAINLSDFDTTLLTRDPDTGEFSRVYPDGRTVIFNIDGLQTTDLDRAGNEIRYTYNPDDSLATMSYVANGRANPDWIWTFNYDTPRNTQHAIRITDPANRESTLTIDKNGNLTAWQEPGLSAPMTFAYGATHNMTHKTDARGNTTTYEYDENGRMVRSKLPPREVFDPVTGQFSVAQEVHDFVPTDRADVVNGLDAGSPAVPNAALRKSAEFNAQQTINGRPFTHTTNKFGAQTGFIDPLGQQTEIERDEQDRIIKTVTPLGNCTTFTYDDNDNLLTETQMDAAACAGGAGLARTTTMTYEPRFNRIRSITDPNGNVTTFEYDYELDLGDAGLLVRKTLPAVDDGSRAVANPVITYNYNVQGQRTEVNDPLGQKMCFVYTTGSADEASDGATPLFAAGITPVPGLLTQQVEDCGGALERATVYRNFDAAGNPQTIESPFGVDDRRTRETVYDARNRTVEIRDPLNSVNRYSYDNGDNLVQIVEDAAIRPITQTMTYNPINQLLTTTVAGEGQQISTRIAYDLNRQITMEQDGNGNVMTFEYDELLRPIATTDPLGNVQTMEYDADDRMTRSVDGRGVATTYSYNGLNRLISETLDPTGLNLTTQFSYDLNDNLLTQTDANGVVTCNTFDALDRLIGTTEDCGGLDVTTTLRYDLVSNLLVTTDALGRETAQGYDALYRLTSFTDALGQVELYGYDSADNLTIHTDERGNSFTYQYDVRDRKITATDPHGETIHFTYDSRNNLSSTRDQLDRVTTFTYDVFDRTIRTDEPTDYSFTRIYDDNDNIVAETDGLGRTTHQTFDGLDRLVSVTDPLGQSMGFVYDAQGNLLREVDKTGGTTQMVYDADERMVSLTDRRGDVTAFTYDSVGNLLSLRDPLGRITSQTFDNLYRLTSISNANQETTTFGYDLVGNALTITDPLANTTTMSYDALNRRLTSTNALGDTHTWQYDPLGNVVEQQDRNGRVRQFAYDALNRPISETWLNADYTATYQYDAAGQLQAASDPVGDYFFGYDAWGRMKSRRERLTTATAADVDFNYVYDIAGNMTRSFEAINGQNVAQTDYAYDAFDRLLQITQQGNGVAEKRIDFTYDALDRTVQERRFGDLAGTQQAVMATASYNADDRLTDLIYTPANAAQIAYAYSYTAADQIADINSADGSSTYTYDDAGQLQNATHDFTANETYAYDDGGNRANHVIGVDNRLQDDGAFTYQYDALGNRTTRTNKASGAVTRYSYDFRNRLIEVVNEDAGGAQLSAVSYTYNVMDERIGRSDSTGLTQQFANADGRVMLLFDGAGNLTSRYLHGMETDSVLAEERIGTAQLLFPLADHQRTVRDIVDATGNLLLHRTFDSFGRSLSPADDYLFGFTGRERDPLTDLNYYRARYYDATVGQFINQDPISYLGGDANLYRYVYNDPVRLTDSGGLSADEFLDADSFDAMFDKVSPFKNDVLIHDSQNPLQKELDRVKAIANDPAASKKQSAINRNNKRRFDRSAEGQKHNRKVNRKVKFAQKVRAIDKDIQIKDLAKNGNFHQKKFANQVLKQQARREFLKNAGRLAFKAANGAGVIDGAILYVNGMMHVLGVAEAQQRILDAEKRERERELALNRLAQRNLFQRVIARHERASLSIQEVRRRLIQADRERERALQKGLRDAQAHFDAVVGGKGGAFTGNDFQLKQQKAAIEQAIENGKAAVAARDKLPGAITNGGDPAANGAGGGNAAPAGGLNVMINPNEGKQQNGGADNCVPRKN